VDDGMYLKYLIKYIHRNPIEAKITKSLEEYRWCSHRAYLDMDEYTWLTTDEVLSRFSLSRLEAKQRLKDFVEITPEISDDSLDISKALRQGVYGGSDFIQKFNPMLIDKSHKQRTTKEITIQEALIQVCQKFQVDLSTLSSSCKHTHLVNARSVLALLGRLGEQKWNLQNVAKLLNKNHGSISRLASRAKNNPELFNLANHILSG
jgi:hypothetical protein